MDNTPKKLDLVNYINKQNIQRNIHRVAKKENVAILKDLLVKIDQKIKPFI